MADSNERLANIERKLENLDDEVQKVKLVQAVTAEQFRVITSRLDKIEQNQEIQAKKHDERNVWIQRLLIGAIASYFLNWILPLVTRVLNGP